jgi:hypothetical protein
VGLDHLGGVFLAGCDLVVKVVVAVIPGLLWESAVLCVLWLWSERATAGGACQHGAMHWVKQ